MKKSVKLLGLFLILTVVYSCNCIQGEGPVDAEVREIGEFEDLKVNFHSKVYLFSDTNYSLRIEGQKNLFSHVQTRQSGKTLTLDFKPGCYKSDEDITFYITLPVFKEISINSSAIVTGNDSFDLEDFDGEINGSGKIVLTTFAKKIDIEITGSGEVQLKGTAEQLNVDITGSGEVDAGDLNTYKANVDITGSGSSLMNAHDRLKARIIGSGTVKYKGKPDLETNVKGSGTVKKVD